MTLKRDNARVSDVAVLLGATPAARYAYAEGITHDWLITQRLLVEDGSGLVSAIDNNMVDSTIKLITVGCRIG